MQGPTLTLARLADLVASLQPRSSIPRTRRALRCWSILPRACDLRAATWCSQIRQRLRTSAPFPENPPAAIPFWRRLPRLTRAPCALPLTTTEHVELMDWFATQWQWTFMRTARSRARPSRRSLMRSARGPKVETPQLAGLDDVSLATCRGRQNHPQYLGTVLDSPEPMSSGPDISELIAHPQKQEARSGPV